MLNSCPSCGLSLHYSSAFDEQLCLECGWCCGEEYVSKPPEVCLQTYQMLVGGLLKQYWAHTITYKDYHDIISYELRLGKNIHD